MFKVSCNNHYCYDYYAVSRTSAVAVRVSSRYNGCGLHPGRDSAWLYITDSWDLMHNMV